MAAVLTFYDVAACIGDDKILLEGGNACLLDFGRRSYNPPAGGRRVAPMTSGRGGAILEKLRGQAGGLIFRKVNQFSMVILGHPRTNQKWYSICDVCFRSPSPEIRSSAHR